MARTRGMQLVCMISLCLKNRVSLAFSNSGLSKRSLELALRDLIAIAFRPLKLMILKDVN